LKDKLVTLILDYPETYFLCMACAVKLFTAVITSVRQQLIILQDK
jgi:hypothetical protein